MKHIFAIALFAAMLVGCGSNRNAEQSPTGTVTTISVDEFAKTIGKKSVRLIDVRTPKEYAEGHIAKAENIDVKATDFASRIQDAKGKVAVYCRSGRRSLMAAEQLAAKDCTVYNLDGGIIAWQKAGKPLEK